jgi:hypothetical protein
VQVATKRLAVLYIFLLPNTDKDGFYNSERYKQIRQNPNMISKLIPNINHILEYDDNVLGSIDILKNVIAEIEQF